MALPTLPDHEDLDPSGDYARAQAWSMLEAQYNNAGNYAQWAHNTLDYLATQMSTVTSEDIVGPELQGLLDMLGTVPAMDFNTVDYNAPAAPTYTAIPSYTAPTLGTIQAIPDIDPITIPDAPSSAISFTNTAFSDSLVTAMKAQIESDLGTDGEAAMFQRHEARVAAERAKAYTEITTQFSARGFDMPPGALLAKQTEMNNESGKRLTDVSADIMNQKSQLAMSTGAQIADLLGRLHDSKIMRDFEAAKTTVQLAFEGFKATVEGLLGKANIDKAIVDATVASNEGTVKVFLGQIEGQTAPMKAIADSNQAQASAYGAAVQGASASVQASALPEELKLKAMGVQGDIAGKAATLSVEAAMRGLTTQIETIRGLSQAAMQMIASSMNTVSAGASFGYSNSSGTSYNGNWDELSANVKYEVDNS